jgi:hypothetical protein
MDNQVMTYDERMAIIKRVCDRVMARKEKMNKVRSRSASLRDSLNERPKKVDKLAELDDMSEIHYGDAEKYARANFFDTYNETTRYDNEWN